MEQLISNGLLIIQSKNKIFREIFTEITGVDTAGDSLVTYGQSASLHKLSDHQCFVITAGYIVKRFLNSGSSIPSMLQELKFAYEFQDDKKNSHFLEVQFYKLGADNYIQRLLFNTFSAPELAAILIFTMTAPVESSQKYSYSRITQGDELFMISSPFGLMSSHLYLNCFRKAYVSLEYSNDSSQLLILDVINQTGQEGGSIYTQQGKFAGMLIPTPRSGISDKKFFGFAINWNSILAVIQSHEAPTLQNLKAQNSIFKAAVQFATQVYQNSKFGCGVLVSNYKSLENYIITVRHIFNETAEGSKFVYGKDRKEAELVTNFCGNVDFAIGKISSGECGGYDIVKLQKCRIPDIGEPIFVVGFLYNVFDWKPIVKRGNVLKIVHDYNQQVALIATDCLIQNGHSGSGLFDYEGNLLGVVSFNIHDLREGKICDLNYSIAMNQFQEVFRELQEGSQLSDKSKLQLSQNGEFWNDVSKLQTRNQVPQIDFRPKL